MICLILEGVVEDATFLGIPAVLQTRSATLMKYSTVYESSSVANLI
jgi:hypothetical protein